MGELTLGLDQRERGLNQRRTEAKSLQSTREHVKAFPAARWLGLHSHHPAHGCLFKAQCSRVDVCTRCQLELGFGFSFL